MAGGAAAVFCHRFQIPVHGKWPPCLQPGAVRRGGGAAAQRRHDYPGTGLPMGWLRRYRFFCGYCGADVVCTQYPPQCADCVVFAVLRLATGLARVDYAPPYPAGNAVYGCVFLACVLSVYLFYDYRPRHLARQPPRPGGHGGVYRGGGLAAAQIPAIFHPIFCRFSVFQPALAVAAVAPMANAVARGAASPKPCAVAGGRHRRHRLGCLSSRLCSSRLGAAEL